MKNTLWLLIRADYASNKRALILSIIALFTFAFLTFALFCEIATKSYYEDEALNNTPELIERFFGNATVFLYYVFGSLFFLLLSTSFGKYHRRKAPFSVMLPASQRVKFIYIVLCNFVLLPLTLWSVSRINHIVWNFILGTDFIFDSAKLGVVLHTLAFGAIAFVCGILFKKGYIYALALFAFITLIYFKISDLISAINSLLVFMLLVVFIVMALFYAWRRFKNLIVDDHEK